MKSAQRKILLLVHGFVSLIIAPVKPRIKSELDLLCLILLLVNKLLQVPNLDQLVKENLQGPTVLYFVSLFLMERTFPSLVVLPRVSSHGCGLFEVRFISDLGEKFVDWFFKNHIEPLPHSVVIVN